MKCSVGESTTMFQWLGTPDGRTPVINNSSITISSNSSISQLQFGPLQQSHSGLYSCRSVTDEDTLLSHPIEIHVKGTLLSTIFHKNSISNFSFQLPLYPPKSLRALVELQEKVSTSLVEYLELKISIHPSLISGLNMPVVDSHKLEQTLALSPSLEFDYLMLLIIPVLLRSLQTTSQVA